MNFYYITYLNRADEKGSVYSNINLGLLDDYEIAEKYLRDYFRSLYSASFGNHDPGEYPSEEIKERKEWYPLLITNDPRFYLMYKGVFKLNEFKLFCQICSNNKTLTNQEKIIFYIGIIVPQAYDNCLKLINNEGKFAYEVTKMDEEIVNHYTGQTYEFEVERFWKIQPTFFINDDIKKRLSQGLT